MKNNEQALAAFMKALAESKAKLETLTAFAEDHMNRDPEEITWCHVGDAEHLNSLLQAAIDAFRLGKTN